MRFKFIAVLPALLGILAACQVPQPTTQVSLKDGVLKTPKDWKAKLIVLDESVEPNGTKTSKLRIEGLDASASNVIDSQRDIIIEQTKSINLTTEKLIDKLSIPGVTK